MSVLPEDESLADWEHGQGGSLNMRRLCGRYRRKVREPVMAARWPAADEAYVERQRAQVVRWLEQWKLKPAVPTVEGTVVVFGEDRAWMAYPGDFIVREYGVWRVLSPEQFERVYEEDVR